MTMDPANKVAIIAIGTEVTSGEILNSNASWLAAQIDTCGFEVVCHLAVPDDSALLKSCFDFLRGRVGHVLTIGGLGPTTDDKTRQSISEWAHQPLAFDDASWSKISERFQRVGQSVPESNKHQCYFPKTAAILDNAHGSANAFRLATPDFTITALPGPPKELQGVWSDHLKDHFTGISIKIGKTLNRTKLLTWTCLGVPESRLAEQVETIMAGSGLAIGYRASVPFVVVKVWAPAAPDDGAQGYLDRLDAALDDICVARNGSDHLEPLKRKLQTLIDSGCELHLTDKLTAGLLGTKILSISGARDYSVRLCGADPALEIQLNATLEGPELIVKSETCRARVVYADTKISGAIDDPQLRRQQAVLAERVLIDLGKQLP